MKIQQYFEKPIDRPIEGVIKADDLESLKTEVEEYVITNEIVKQLTKLLDAYNADRTNSIGVWISGFFGSGKSHLLKMLALLLENRQINGTSVLDEFLKKLPDSDAMLKADMKKAVQIPSRSILFNIDQKADAISKSKSEAVLGVFVKVFDEFCGYYGHQGFIAQFERDLDKVGIYQDFQRIFQDVAGISWHEGRESFNINRRKIAEAYAQLTGNSGESAQNIIQSYREDYKLSIEDFAIQVNDYIQQQEKGFRLNFYVDEVGQYIADNVKLMTNLQTISESLATKCKGQAWLMVTSQDDMSTVLGEFGKHGGDDFSKITARFKTQIHLSSQDVAEVIQKRLLKKNDAGELSAKRLYASESQNFGMLFNFPDVGGTKFRLFKDEEEFVSSYPFAPYHYSLFQSAIESLSRHNTFTGKHNSVGERSMLGVFQDVVKSIGDMEDGSLASFDRMFEGIRNTLKSRTQSRIFDAEQHIIANPFAVKVLKALFLVKYVQGFRATPRNLRVLMQEHFDEDISALQAKINEALALLERQTYIQRNDDAYEYLTDEEHDVEMEIKNVSTDNEEILKYMEDIFFSEILRDNKIRYEQSEQDYSFNKYIDEKLRGRDRGELSIDFITPFSDFSGDIHALTSHSLGKPEMLVLLPQDEQFVQDIYMVLRTDKYVKRNHGVQGSETKTMILNIKSSMNSERKKSVSRRAAELIGQAQIIVSGDKVEISGEEAKGRILKGFNILIARTYPNLRMLNDASYSENKIGYYLRSFKNDLFKADHASMNEAEMEMYAFIQNNKDNGGLTTMNRIVDRFSSRPFGWPLAATQCLAAMLAGRGKVEAWLDGNLLEDGPLESALKNTYGFNQLRLEPTKAPPAGWVKKMQRFYADYFNEPIVENDPRSLIRNVKDALAKLTNKLDRYYFSRDAYPFLGQLKPSLEELKQLMARDYDFYTEEFLNHANELLDTKEALLDPLCGFMAENSPKREIYDELKAFISNKKPDILTDDINQLGDILDDHMIYLGNRLMQARVELNAIKVKVEQKLAAEKRTALENVKELQDQMHAMSDFGKLSTDQQIELDRDFEQISYTLNQQSLAVSIRDKANEYQVSVYPTLLTKMSQWAAPKPKPPVGPEGPGMRPYQPPAAPTYIHVTELYVRKAKNTLENGADVKAYCKALQEAMLGAIEDNKRIQL